MYSTGKTATLLSILIVIATAYAETVPSDAPLAPAAATYLDLLMCANTAEEFRSAPSLASRYRNLAFSLADRVEESDWSVDLFDSGLIAAQEGYRELEVFDLDTRKDWQLRHFTDEHCQQQIVAATNFLDQRASLQAIKP